MTPFLECFGNFLSMEVQSFLTLTVIDMDRISLTTTVLHSAVWVQEENRKPCVLALSNGHRLLEFNLD